MYPIGSGLTDQVRGKLRDVPFILISSKLNWKFPEPQEKEEMTQGDVNWQTSQMGHTQHTPGFSLEVRAQEMITIRLLFIISIFIKIPNL